MKKKSNQLIHESSPYLLQHAHNPVEWYPWGEEALQKAKQEDKPILVSIGYSACHWCHVMEKESFEDEDTAEIMNKNFINIKIDREERPDVDHIYMDAVQAISGSGGWPLNVFLTPDCKPFYGGTYFPPQRAFNRASWKEVLLGVAQLFKEQRKQVEAQADELTRHIQQSGSLTSAAKTSLISDEDFFTKQQCHEIFNNIMKQADKWWGGFGNAPKFPQTFTINYLLRYYHYTAKLEALQQACLSLDKMLEGGIYDQIGGGFSRYSTDKEWLAPHFEKMLYDNALLIFSLCDAFQLTGNPFYKRTIEQTIAFINRELCNKEGGFYSALDADSEGVEGKYYVWSYDEIKNILGDDAELFCSYYNVTPNGNWEHQNILRVLTPLKEFARQRGVEEQTLLNLLSSSSEKLLLQREKRVHPGLDDKILLGWNALMITALCKSGAAFNRDDFKQLAIKNYAFLFSKFRVGKEDYELYHTYKNGTAKYPAFLDDYAYLIQACIYLQEITSDLKYLEHAKFFTEFVMENFTSPGGDYFYYTSKKQQDVIVRKQEIYDGATPSGNSVMAFNLNYLSLIYNDNSYKQIAMKMLKGLQEVIIKHPTSFGNWACLIIDEVAGINELAICGNGYQKLRDDLLKEYIPNKVMQAAGEPIDTYPLLANKSSAKEPLIYLCRNYSCQAPVENTGAVISQIVNSSKF